MNNLYRIAICIPVYGVEKYIERCAVSLFEQTYSNIDYIFVNDCSPDRSIEILESVIQRYPYREKSVQIINHERNRGLAAARNTAIEAVKCDFLMHVDSDDWVQPDMVEKCVNIQRLTGSDIISVDIIREWKYYSEHIVLPDFKDNEDMTLQLLNGSSFHSIYGHLIRTALYRDNDIKLEEGLNMGEDYCIIPRLSYFARKVYNLHEFLYHYNFQNENSYVGSFSIQKAEQSWQVSKSLKEFFSDKGKEYMDSILVADVNRIVVYMKASIRNQNMEYYNSMCERLKSIDAKYIEAQPLSSRILLMLRWKKMRVVYYKILSNLKSFYRSKIAHVVANKL